MIELLTYETAAGLLELDDRDEKRNRILLGVKQVSLCILFFITPLRFRRRVGVFYHIAHLWLFLDPQHPNLS